MPDPHGAGQPEPAVGAPPEPVGAQPRPEPGPAGDGESPVEDGGGPADRTGHPRVDAALDALERAGDLPPAEQVAAYEAAHRTLQETLTTIDEGQS